MPYKDKVLQREAIRRAVAKHRGITGEGITGEGITQYPAIVEALCDPVKRNKLEAIYQSLKAHNVLGEVRYGVFGPTFEVVGEMLEVTEVKPRGA